MATMSFGEKALARAEARARAHTARRRFIALFLPAMVTTVWATTDLLVARNERLVDAGAGPLRQVADIPLPALWAIFLVIGPMLLAVKVRPLPGGAALAAVAGPIMTPMLFGAGGWHPWQIATVLLACTLVLAAAATRARLRR